MTTQAVTSMLLDQGMPANSHRRLRTSARVLAGAALVALIVWRVGTGAFVDAFRLIDGWSLAAAFLIGVVTTACCAWRWRLVARGVGVHVSMRDAIPAYYRSQFLNSTLPGGVVGDVHRAVRHGRDVGDVARGARAVAWERVAGQAVQIGLTIVVLLVLPSPVQRSMPALALLVAAALVGITIVGLVLPSTGESRWARSMRALASDLRHGLFARGAWPGIVIASAVVVLGHATTLLVAAHTAGVEAPVGQLLPLALMILLAMSIPLSIGGWGPREGAAAGAFALAGLGAAAGVTTAVIYGVLALFATLPGAIVVVAARSRRHSATSELPAPQEASASSEGATHG